MELQRLVLKIKRQDGSVYWIEYFNYIEDLNIWLTEEKTRFYWDPNYTSEIYTLDNQNNETLYTG